METLPQYMIDLSVLEVGTHEFDFQLDNSYLQQIEKTELLGGNVQVKVTLVVTPDDFELSMRVNGVVQLVCDRCLDSMDCEVKVNEMIDIEEDDKQLDLYWLAYEQIIVNLPLAHSHPEGGCNPEMITLLQAHLCSTIEEPDTN